MAKNLYFIRVVLPDVSGEYYLHPTADGYEVKQGKVGAAMWKYMQGLAMIAHLKITGKSNVKLEKL